MPFELEPEIVKAATEYLVGRFALDALVSRVTVRLRGFGTSSQVGLETGHIGRAIV